MGNNCFVIAATPNYLPMLTALLNSIEIWHGKGTSVVALLHNFTDETPPTGYSYPIHYIHTEGGNPVHATAIERFRLATEVADRYDAICLLDADMFLTANTDTFFDVASCGFIVTGSNGMIINFNSDYQAQYGVDLGVSDYPYPKIHTSVPIFINSDHMDWFRALYESRRIDNWDDFLYLNLLGIKMDKPRSMLCMPPYTFTGIHHWMMKPATAVFTRGDILLSGTEEQVYMIHGKWHDPGWLQDLLPTMRKYLGDETIGDKGLSRVEGALGTLKDEYRKYLTWQR